MSSADLCTIGMLDQLIATGVKVLKFEGRGKPTEYVDSMIRTSRSQIRSRNINYGYDYRVGKSHPEKVRAEDRAVVTRASQGQ